MNKIQAVVLAMSLAYSREEINNDLIIVCSGIYIEIDEEISKSITNNGFQFLNEKSLGFSTRDIAKLASMKKLLQFGTINKRFYVAPKIKKKCSYFVYSTLKIDVSSI